jgi:hypothetical protein
LQPFESLGYSQAGFYNSTSDLEMPMTPDLIHALSVAGSILIGVFILIVVVSFVAVRRGEVEMEKNVRPSGPSARH